MRLVYLKGDEALIARRIATRHEHFMPPSLLHSQFEALEEPGPDEKPIVVSIEPRPQQIVGQILSALGMAEGGEPSGQAICESTGPERVNFRIGTAYLHRTLQQRRAWRSALRATISNQSNTRGTA